MNATMTESEVRRALDTYREMYDATYKRNVVLEESCTRLYEREANHTEAYGMVCQERDYFKAAAEKWKERAELAEAELRAARELYARESLNQCGSKKEG